MGRSWSRSTTIGVAVVGTLFLCSVGPAIEFVSRTHRLNERAAWRAHRRIASTAFEKATGRLGKLRAALDEEYQAIGQEIDKLREVEARLESNRSSVSEAELTSFRADFERTADRRERWKKHRKEANSIAEARRTFAAGMTGRRRSDRYFWNRIFVGLAKDLLGAR